MRKLMVLVSAACVLFALASVVASSAFALPSVSPSATTNTTDGTSIGKPKYVLTNGNFIECEESSTGTTKEATSSLGSAHIDFKGCVGHVGILTAKCTGLGEAKEGEILILGEYHLVYDKIDAELMVGILFLVNSTHFTCGGLFLNVVSGEQLCLIIEPYVAKTLHKFVCTGVKGVQSGVWFTDAGTEVKPKLTVTEGEEAKPGAAEEAEGLILWLNKEAKNVSTVILMT